MQRSDRIVDAAVGILADQGARALTHRAVDEAAGLPTGSTSNLHRTRRSLVDAVVEHLLEADRVRLGDLQQAGPAPIGARLARFAAETAQHGRREVLARLALLTEPDADALRVGRERLLEEARQALAARGGLPEAVPTLVAMIDGVVIDAVLSRRDVVEPLVARAVDALLEQPR